MSKRLYTQLDMRGNRIISVGDPVLGKDAANKDYVDTGGGDTGAITIASGAAVTDDSKYNAWPTICRMADGNLLLGYTKADGHHTNNNGTATGRISTDEGATWGAEFTIYDHGSLWVSAFGVSISDSGRVFCVLWRDNASVADTGEPGLVYSDDNGSTWSSWVALTNAFTHESFGAGPVLQLASGDLLVTIEGSNTGGANRSSHTLRSSDDGLTWGSEVTVRNYATDSRPYYESRLLELASGNLLCVHRCSANAGLPHYISVSTDDGLTWGTPYAAYAGFAASNVIQLSTGTLIAVTRRDSDFATIAYTSIDDGLSWNSAVLLDDTMYEMEYGCPVELLDRPGHVLIVYGYQPSSSVSNSDIYEIYVQEITNSLIVRDEGVPLVTGAQALDFVGAGVTASGTGAIKTITIPGAPPGSPLTTKGDLYGYDTADARIPVGADGSYPRADSTDDQGIVWSTLHLEPHVAYDGTVVLDGNGDPVMVLVS